MTMDPPVNDHSTTKSTPSGATSAKPTKKPQKVQPTLLAPLPKPEKVIQPTIRINLNLNLQNPEENIFSIRDMINAQLKPSEASTTEKKDAGSSVETDDADAEDDDLSDMEDDKPKESKEPKEKDGASAPEEPVKKVRRRRKDDEDDYDVEDPFIDDSEILLLNEEEGIRKPSRSGYFIWRGPLETNVTEIPESPKKRKYKKKAPAEASVVDSEAVPSAVTNQTPAPKKRGKKSAPESPPPPVVLDPMSACAQELDLFKKEAANAEFEVNGKKQFPDSLMPLLLVIARKAYDATMEPKMDNQVLETILKSTPFTSVKTIRNLIIRSFLQDYITELREVKLKALYEVFKTKVEKTVAGLAKDAKFPWNKDIRKVFWDILVLETRIEQLDDEVREVVNKQDPIHDEGRLRRQVYDKMMTYFPEGMVGTNDFSRNYSSQKKALGKNSPKKEKTEKEDAGTPASTTSAKRKNHDSEAESNKRVKADE